MKKCKRITAMIMTVSTLVFLCTPMEKTYGDEKIVENGINIGGNISNVLINEEGEYEYIDKKIQEDVKNNTGLIDEKSEKLLNEKGLLDDEIERLNKEEIKNIEENVDENTKVFSNYYSVEDTRDLSEVPITAEEKIQLSEEQVNKYIAEKYYDVETDLTETINEEFEKKKHNDTIEKVSKTMGLQVKEAKAYTESHGGVNDAECRTMLRETMIVCQVKGENVIQVTFKYEWTEMPQYRQVDTVVLSWDGGIYDSCSTKYSSKTHVLHSWVEYTITYPMANQEKCISEYGEEKLTRVNSGAAMNVGKYFIRNGYAECVFKMHADYNYGQNPTIDKEYEYEAITMHFYLKEDRINFEGVQFYPLYLHQKEKISYDPENIVLVVVNVVDNAYASAVYSFASGLSSKYVTSNSGPITKSFMYEFK